jgi:hypothetical protein
MYMYYICGLWPPDNVSCIFLTWYQSIRFFFSDAQLVLNFLDPFFRFLLCRWPPRYRPLPSRSRPPSSCSWPPSPRSWPPPPRSSPDLVRSLGPAEVFLASMPARLGNRRLDRPQRRPLTSGLSRGRSPPAVGLLPFPPASPLLGSALCWFPTGSAAAFRELVGCSGISGR